MNLLDTNITWVGKPYYISPPREDESERWFMNKDDALKVSIGDTIQV